MSYQNDFLSYTPSAHCLSGRVIVTTGAGSGIGKTIAIACAQAGATVILLGRTMAKLESVYDTIEQLGGPQPAIFPINFESATAQDYEQLKNALNEAFGKIDGLLHNAAILGTHTPIAHYSSAEWASVMQVNCTAPFMLTQSLLPLLMKASDASIVFTNADVSQSGKAYWGAYACSKAASENLMQTLADEYSENKTLRFNSINPGPTRTALRAKAYPAEHPQSVTAPEQHINQYLFLLGPASQNISGRQFCIAPN
ncbi:MAG: YciK family oxidoreductase [Marinagarivorans sp.]|nr:YciK family oxidoreductase [Marinagarivorans sp.]